MTHRYSFGAKHLGKVILVASLLSQCALIACGIKYGKQLHFMTGMADFLICMWLIVNFAVMFFSLYVDSYLNPGEEKRDSNMRTAMQGIVATGIMAALIAGTFIISLIEKL